jgi:hypothetical protein
VTRLTVIPVTLREARRFIAEHHRHNDPPHQWRFGVGLENGKGLVGVAVAAQPRGRKLDDGRTLEITRVAVDGTPMANSMLYAALIRAGKALGFTRFYTYTLPHESGATPKAVGFRVDSENAGGPWNMPSRFRDESPNLFGEVKSPQGPKVRWILEVVQ